jgi:hypothetical protein
MAINTLLAATASTDAMNSLAIRCHAQVFNIRVVNYYTSVKRGKINEKLKQLHH